MALLMSEPGPTNLKLRARGIQLILLTRIDSSVPLDSRTALSPLESARISRGPSLSIKVTTNGQQAPANQSCLGWRRGFATGLAAKKLHAGQSHPCCLSCKDTIFSKNRFVVRRVAAPPAYNGMHAMLDRPSDMGTWRNPDADTKCCRWPLRQL